jgi:hypothetical protein
VLAAAPLPPRVSQASTLLRPRFAWYRQPSPRCYLYKTPSPIQTFPSFPPDSISGSQHRQSIGFDDDTSRQHRMRDRENVQNSDTDEIHDPHLLHSDRGCSAETSINHRPRAFHAVGGGPSRPRARFENMLCRRVATSDPANFRPRKLLRWAGESDSFEL